MKFIKKSTLLLAGLALMLFACSPDNVAPGNNDSAPGLAGAVGDAHPALDTICQRLDTIFLLREDNGSAVVDKCYGPAGARPCNPGEQVPWGYLEMYEGYYADSNFIDCNFTMAPGWYCDFNNWEFGLTNSFTFDQNGVPTINNDWGTRLVNPAQNKWQIRLWGGDMPANDFDISLRVGGVKLNLFGAPVAGSNTVLWGKNKYWNVTGHPQASNSPWVTHVQLQGCMSTPPPTVDTAHICEVVYTGLTCTGNTMNSTTLHPTTTETGVVTYLWSNGATTQDLTVSPTSTTNYSVTIKVDGVTRHVVIFTVNVINVSCTITGGGNGGGGNNGNGGGGNCGNGGSGSGSGHGGSGSGNGGSGNGGSGSGWGHGGGGNCGNGGSGSGNGGSGSGNGGSGSGNGGSGSGNGNGNSICGDVNQVVSSTGCSNNNNIVGPVNNSGTALTNTGHKITIKLDHTLPAGTQYQIRWKRSGSGTASLKVSESASNSSYAQNGPAFTTSSSSYVTKTLTTAGPTRYLRLESTSSVDLYIDAVTYCYTPAPTTTPGVKICHIPPGNPNGAATICVRYNQLSNYIQGVCSSNGGGNGGNGNGGGGNCGNGGSGSGNGGSGSGSGHGGSGSGSGHGGYGGGHGGGGNCGNGGGGSGSGSGHGGSGSGSGHGGGCGGHGTHNGGNGSGCHGGGGNSGTYLLGACNSNPCL